MLEFSFLNYIILTPLIVLIFFIWFFFIKNNFYYVRINPGSNDILKNSNFLKKVNYNFFTNFFISIFLYIILYIFFFKFDYLLFWFNHLKFNNIILNLVIVLFFINFIMINIIKFYKNKNINFNIDYFFALFNLSIFIPMMYLSNSMYTFLFLLESNSILILYKFSVSKYFFKSPKENDKFKFLKNTPKHYINMLFFQYWINFFSSIILFVSVFNILLLLGTSEWFLINVLNKFNFNIYYNDNFYYNFFLYFIFILGMFFKIGFTPSHLFKIEVYRGIPLISILFYTVYYFMSFFLFFVVMFFYYINSFRLFIWFFLFIFIIFGLIYIITLLFDINLLKTFFAYSTVINSLTFIILLFVSFN